MNILEKYITDNNQFIIIIGGIPGTSKTIFAKRLCKNLNEGLSENVKINLFRLSNYLIKDKHKTFTEDNIDFKIYDCPEDYDWDKLNEDVSKEKGAIIVGNIFDGSKIKFKYDISYYFDTSYINYKDYIIEKKILKDVDEKIIDIYVYKIFKPMCEEFKKTINYKIFNIKKDTMFLEIYDQVFKFIINYLQKKVYE